MEKGKKTREANLELLRIIAMFMIIILHYLGKGNVLFLPYENEFCTNSALGWILEALSYGAVNIYVLISGYFLAEAEFKLEKVLRLWLQVMFYSVGIFIVCLCFKMITIEDCKDIYFTSKFILPLSSQQYWFASIYILFYCFSPFFAVMLRNLSKKKMQALMIAQLIFFTCTFTMILPTSQPVEDKGMGILWFMTLFTIAVYIRRFVQLDGKRMKHILYYLLFSLLTFASLFAMNLFSQVTGKLQNLVDIFYNYNSLTVLAASVALFIAFLNIKIKEGMWSRIIIGISGLTFGIYLLHEHYLLRDLWIKLWRVDTFLQKPYFVLHCLGLCVLVFLICGIIEYLRKQLFHLLFYLPPYKWLEKKLGKVNAWVNDNTQ